MAAANHEGIGWPTAGSVPLSPSGDRTGVRESAPVILPSWPQFLKPLQRVFAVTSARYFWPPVTGPSGEREPVRPPVSGGAQVHNDLEGDGRQSRAPQPPGLFP